MRLTVDRLGHLGDGIAMGPDGPVFIPQVLPGEVVEGEVAGDRMAAPKIVTPSASRVRPPCPHARSCGGCLLQHVSDEFAADWKLGIVRGALLGQGLDAPLRPTVQSSPPKSRRRATLAGRRTRGGALIGFHARGSDTLITVPGCILLHPDLMAAFPALEALVIAGGSRSTELALSVTRTLGGVDVSVTGGKPLDAALLLKLARVVEAQGLARLTWNGEDVAFRTAPVLRFGKGMVTLPPGAFLQATDHGEAALLAAVRKAVGNARRVADLFSGAGTFALPLAETAEVHAVEGDPALLAALDQGWRRAQGLHRVTTEVRDLFRRPLQPDEFRGVDAVVIDPPRAGAEAQTEALAQAGVSVIAAVSCNPVTFARDSRILVAAGYRIDWVQVIDQFRWSAHVELVAAFTKA